MKALTNKQRTSTLMPIFIISLVLLSYLSMNIGYMDISIKNVIGALFGNATREEMLAMWIVRLPKAAVAIIVGLSLTVSGAVMQGVTRNPLATPSMIGVSAGSNLAVLIVILMIDKGLSMPIPVPLAAVLGGMGAFMIVYGLTMRYNLSPIKLILNGIAINSCLGAVTLALSMKLSEDGYLMRSLFMAGSLSHATWPMICLAVVISLPLLAYIMYKAFYLNILNLNEEMAIGLGLELKTERRKLLYVTVVLTSISAYIAGGISFIGMIAPHIAKRIVGSNYKLFLPLAVLIGINIVLVADVFCRILAIGGADIPVGTLISIIGAPYLLYLLFTQDR